MIVVFATISNSSWVDEKYPDKEAFFFGEEKNFEMG